MEIPTPSFESIGKFFGGVLVTVTAGWMALKRMGLIGQGDGQEKVEATPIQYLRRAEDTGVRTAIEAIDRRVDSIEKRFIEERGLMLGQITASEARVRDDVNNLREELSNRIDNHNQGINERLDAIINQIKK